MNGLSKKQLIYLGVAFSVLIILAIILTLKPWEVKTNPVTADKISDMNAYTPVLSLDNQDIYYYDLTALNLFKYNLKTKQKTQISQKMTDTPDILIWSPDRNNVIMRIYYDKQKFEAEGSIFAKPGIEDGSNTIWNYNLASQKITLLKSQIAASSLSPDIINPIWSADSKKIIYYDTDPSTNKNQLNIANLDGANEVKLDSLPSDIFSIITYNSNSKVIYYQTQPNGETGMAEIFKYNLTTGKKESILTGQVSSKKIDDQKFIMSNGQKSFLYDSATDSQKTFSFLLVPEQATADSQKTNLLIDNIVGQTEHFYILDLATLKIKKKFNPGTLNTGYTDLALDNDGNIFFVNNKNLYEVKK